MNSIVTNEILNKRNTQPVYLLLNIFKLPVCLLTSYGVAGYHIIGSCTVGIGGYNCSNTRSFSSINKLTFYQVLVAED